MRKFVTEVHQDACLTAVKRLVSFPSVLNEGENGTPFGQAIQNVLEDTLHFTEELGFRTYLDPEGYYGYAEIGDAAECLAILCHLDVVPAGDVSEWQTNPFEAVVKDGIIYGRGVQDDKGPSMVALYAVKALIDAGVTFNKRIRFIFGTDEETLWRCMNRYNQIEEVATMGFAPDSSFPLTYAEKGLLQAKLVAAGDANFDLEVGEAYNVVPGKASYRGKYKTELLKKLAELGIDSDVEGDCVTVLGVPMHSKDAALATNALIRLAKALVEIVPNQTLDFLANRVGEDATGANLFGSIEDEPSGKLSFNVAGLTLNAEKTEVRLDLRIPVLADKEQLVATLTEIAAAYGLTYEEFDYLAPLYVPLDSKLVSTLMTVYQEKTGDMTPAVSSGGATFARTMPNCVAFGACFPTTPQTEHQANECTPVEDLYRAMDIYAEAIYRLAAQ
ncbi:dipeptidase [Streptococcus massiliensis]|uniref:ArcT n=1 Tax=Streptococcus massiliensis TaxID=313439 RepID=A0A380KZU9_9STRE|nr:dipeptidase [Streptococcus massiliensis]SUN76829.1 ArcT [Streptococcus massiliensis]